MSAFIENPDCSIIYSEATETMYSVPKPAKKEDDLGGGDDKVAVWGSANDFPQQVDKALALNGDLASGLDWQARAMYAGGLAYEVIDLKDDATDETAKPPKKKTRILEIEDFLFRNQSYLMQAGKDFYKYINVFPEMILNTGRTKIDWLTARPAGHCRLALQNKSSAITKCYVNANWPDAEYNHKDTLKRPVIDPFLRPEELRKRRDGLEYIYPLSYPTGKSYYQLADWNGIRTNGWLDLANEIPKFKMALMKNQMTVKYHIEMPDYWMGWKYQDSWDKMDAKQKQEAQIKEVAKFDDFLKASENAGKSITTPFKTDPNSGQKHEGWKITAIDDKLKDGMYLEDSVEATIKIFSAIGLDPALFGIIPGKGGSNRSGSDKREALNIYISMIQAHIDIVLRPYDFISWFNGWNNEKQMIRWYFKAPMLQTLDQVKPSERETTTHKTEGNDAT